MLTNTWHLSLLPLWGEQSKLICWFSCFSILDNQGRKSSLMTSSHLNKRNLHHNQNKNFKSGRVSIISLSEHKLFFEIWQKIKQMMTVGVLQYWGTLGLLKLLSMAAQLLLPCSVQCTSSSRNNTSNVVAASWEGNSQPPEQLLNLCVLRLFHLTNVLIKIFPRINNTSWMFCAFQGMRMI